jgi:putative addiction module killer protein
MYAIEEYQTVDGKKPFGEWLLDLKDKRAQAKLRARITRAELGNLGDWKALEGTGVYEMREHYGPGYRIYFSIIGRKIVLLLVGSTKQDQKRAIARAKDYLADYERRRDE